MTTNKALEPLRAGDPRKAEEVRRNLDQLAVKSQRIKEDLTQAVTDLTYTYGDGVDLTAKVVTADIDTAAGLQFATGSIQVNIGSGLEFSSGAIRLDIGNGLTFVSNELRVNIGSGLDFNSGAIEVDGSDIYPGTATVSPPSSGSSFGAGSINPLPAFTKVAVESSNQLLLNYINAVVARLNTLQTEFADLMTYLDNEGIT